jgi:hypothetical protein
VLEAATEEQDAIIISRNRFVVVPVSIGKFNRTTAVAASLLSMNGA